jgi:mannose-1-phosphate guanylyltransferase
MRAIILVGGFGTRLRPLTYTRPKPLLPLLDRPGLDWAVERLVRAGVDEVVLSLGYLPAAFRAAYPDGRCAGAALVYAVEPEPLDTAGAIRFAASHAGLDRGAEPFFVLNGDVISDADPATLLAAHRQRGAEGTVALTEVEDPSRYGVVLVDGAGRVGAFVEKPPKETAPTRWINAGSYVLEPSVIARIPDGRKVSIERETFPAMVADGTLYGVQDRGYWIDTGTPATYLQVQLDLARRDGAGRAGYRHRRATVGAGATVRDAVLMDGATVAAGAVVTSTVLLPGACVEAGATVDGSILGFAARVGSGAQVIGTILGDGEVVVPGAHLVDARQPAEG